MEILASGDLKKVEDYLILEKGSFKLIFSTAENNRSFNRNTESGINELNKIKNEFNISNLVYIKQIHSDIVYKYEGENINELEGDAIISNEKDTAVGVFTADCVPILIVNEEKKAFAAIHSGWKGTFKGIVKKTLEKMIKEYNINIKTTKIFIGPHIKQCCYEVSEELKEKFIKEKDVPKEELFKGRNLSMEKCIESDAISMGILGQNIYSLNLCTYCSEDVKLHSYRKSDGAYGRLFAFVVLK